VTSSTARVSEEGLPLGIPDTNGNEDFTNSATYDSSLTDPNQYGTGKIDFSDVDGDNLTISLTAPTDGFLTSNGIPINWTGSGEQTITGSANGTPIITISIANDGNYSVTLTGQVDHSVTDPSYPGEENDLSFGVTVDVNDGTVTSTGTITVTVEDDAPIALGAENATLTNTLGNILTADLNFEIGADTEGATYSLLRMVNGEPVELQNGDPVINSNGGLQAESNDINLVWSQNPDGSWSAVTDDSSSLTVFTIQVNDNGTYTVEMDPNNPLDGAAGDDLILGQGVSGGNSGWHALFDVPFVDDNNDNIADGADHMVYITAKAEDGSFDTVNTTASTLAVGKGTDIGNDIGSSNDGDPTTSETLSIWFSEPTDPTVVDPNDIESGLIFEEIESVDIGLGNWNNQGNAGGHWIAYNYDAQGNEIKVGEGNFLHDDTLLEITSADINIDPAYDTFVRVDLTADSDASYKISSITGITELGGSNVVLDLAVHVIDGDGDIAVTDFDVIFDADGNIVGSDGVDDAISGIDFISIDGGTGNDTVSFEGATANVTVTVSDFTSIENLTGGSGDDTLTGDPNDNVILGGDGNDIITGGDGSDQLFGGTGNDTINAADGAPYNDTIGDGASDTLDYDIGLDTLVPDPDDVA
jgi:hypothetical protein